MSTSDTTHNVAVAAAEARALLLSVSGTYADDDDVAEIIVDTETSLPDAISAALERIAMLESYDDAIKLRVDQLTARRGRFSASVDRLRSALRSALETTGLKKLECAGGTVSLRTLPRSLIVHDPDRIPEAYRKQPPSVPDKAAIKVAIAAGIEVDGATLSNGGTTIAISRK